MLTAIATAEAATPVRIVRLPIIFQKNSPDLETCAELEIKIARAVHIPMNKTLQLADYVPTETSAKTLNNIWQKMRSQNKKAKLVDAMRPLAEKLDADIIVCPVLKSYNQHVTDFFDWNDPILNSNVRFEMIIYDRRTDELIDKKASQFYRGDYSTTGTAAFLAKICLDKVIDDSGLRQRILAIRN